MSAQGFHGDTFSDGFGGFQTMRKRQQDPVEVFDYPKQFLQGVRNGEVIINQVFYFSSSFFHSPISIVFNVELHDYLLIHRSE